PSRASAAAAAAAHVLLAA
ncbi:hypothetical protein CLOM_g1632, partial [Closterium sp. NIES-68]